MKNIIFFLFLSFLIVGCSSHKVNVSQVQQKSLPNWYLNPPQSSKNYVYITGSGIDKQQAILNALSNFISRLSINISSTFENKIASYGGGLYNKQSMQDIKATVNKFQVTNYTVVRAEQYSFDKFLVLIKVDMNKLYENLKNQLDNRFNTYENEFKYILNENLLKQYIDLKKLYSKLEKEKNYIFILKIINEKFNDKKYLDFINKVKSRLLYVKEHLYVEIDSNNSIIKEDIKKYLTAQGIKLGKSDIKIKINVIKRSFTSYMSLVTYQIYMNVEYKNNVIGNNFFKIVVPKNTNISGYLFNMIKNMSLEKFLNLK